MATWQYEFIVVPREPIRQAFGEVPKEIEPEAFDSRNWWTDMHAPSENELSELLARGSSWSDSMRTWGATDGDRIDLYFDEDELHEILVRIDLRNVSRTFMHGVLELANRYDCVFRTEDGTLLRPEFGVLLQDIAKSSAFRFVSNPTKFLEQLDR